MNAKKNKNSIVVFVRDHRRAIVSILLIAIVVGVMASDFLHQNLEQIFGRAREVIREHPVAGIALFIVVAALSAIIVFFSVVVIVPVAVYAWGRPMTVFLLCVGWLLGGILSYVIGRYPGRRMLRWLAPKGGVSRYEKLFSARSSFPLVALFQFALQSEIPGYILGSVRYPFWRYLVVLIFTEIIFAIGAVYLGESFLRREYGWLIAIALAGVALTTGAMLFFRARMKKM